MAIEAAPSDAGQTADALTSVDAAILVDASVDGDADASRCVGGPTVVVRFDVTLERGYGVGRITLGDKRLRMFAVPLPFGCQPGAYPGTFDAGGDSMGVGCAGDDRGTSMRATRVGDTVVLEGMDYEQLRPTPPQTLPLPPCATVKFVVGKIAKGAPD